MSENVDGSCTTVYQYRSAEYFEDRYDIYSLVLEEHGQIEAAVAVAAAPAEQGRNPQEAVPGPEPPEEVLQAHTKVLPSQALQWEVAQWTHVGATGIRSVVGESKRGTTPFTHQLIDDVAICPSPLSSSSLNFSQKVPIFT